MNARPIPLLSLCLAALIAGCSKPEAAPEPVRSVKTMVVSVDVAGGVHEYAAEVRAQTESRLGFRVPGKMVARSAEVGQHVKAGQLLARLDGADLRLGQDAALAAAKSAQVSYALAQGEFKRFKELRDQGFISAWDLERRETTLQASKAQAEQAQAQARVTGNQTGYASLMASAAGVVTAVDAEVGAVLAAGAPVLRLAHDGPRDAVFAVPEDDAGGLRALLGKPGALKVRPWGAKELLPATVREVAAAADPATRTFLVKADLAGARLQLGQTVTVLQELPGQPGVSKLPLTAVMQRQGKTAVWLLDRASMTVDVQPISVAGADGNSVVVAGGLAPGQTVVTAGVHTLTPGQKVRLYEAGKAAAPTAPAASR